MTGSHLDLVREPDLDLAELNRLRDVFRELSRHVDTHQLLRRGGVTEDELAEACDVIDQMLTARILGKLGAE